MDSKSYITINKHRINLTFETQISKMGRPFRLSGICLQTKKPSVWINNRPYHGTIYTFRYLDETDGFFGFEFDPHGVFVGKVI